MARLAVLNTPDPIAGWKDCRIETNGVTVSCISEHVINKATSLVMIGHSHFPFEPKRTKEGLVVPDEKTRIRIERAMENYGNLLSVTNHTPRSFSTLNPSIAFAPETAQESDFLLASRGILRDDNNRFIASSTYKFDIGQYIDYLKDRLDGVAILAECLSHNQASGRFRDHIRLFERAFAVANKMLIRPLTMFLSSGRGGYDEQEVEDWMLKRHGVTHADGRTTLFDSDVAWVERRSMQAAYDVLLNKNNWHKKDNCRRDVWNPSFGSFDKKGTLFGVRGEEWRISIQAFDEFRRFPLLLDSGQYGTLPIGWWTGDPGSRQDGST